MVILEKWDNVNPGLAHLNISRKRQYSLERIYNQQVLKPYIDFENKTVIDYGCGGGWFGKFFSNSNIKKYIGLDISKRSIEFARENNQYEKTEFNLVNSYDFTKDYSGDILMSLSCIQHFPTGHYLYTFLKSINCKKFEYIILQYRYNGFSGITLFRDLPYKDEKDIIYACYTTGDYIAQRLTNYEVIEIEKNVSKEFINYIYFRRRNNGRNI